MSTGTGIARAREELFAAHLLAGTGFAAQTVACAFRAALAAAEAALLELGRTPEPEPAAVVAAFVRHVVRERGLDPDAGRRLRSLCNRAEQAYADGVVPPAEGPAAIGDATAMVDLVEAWLEHSDYVAIARSAPQLRAPQLRAPQLRASQPRASQPRPRPSNRRDGPVRGRR